jgi:DNA-binding transcriptional MerR regulator
LSSEDKLYYSISEVSEMLDVNASLIRFWEKEFGSFVKPKKNRNGKRMFTTQDIQVLKKIQHLTKEKGYTLSGAKNILKSNKKNIDKDAQIADTMKNIRSFLVELKESL